MQTITAFIIQSVMLCDWAAANTWAALASEWAD